MIHLAYGNRVHVKCLCWPCYDRVFVSLLPRWCVCEMRVCLKYLHLGFHLIISYCECISIQSDLVQLFYEVFTKVKKLQKLRNITMLLCGDCGSCTRKWEMKHDHTLYHSIWTTRWDERTTISSNITMLDKIWDQCINEIGYCYY